MTWADGVAASSPGGWHMNDWLDKLVGEVLPAYLGTLLAIALVYGVIHVLG